MKSPIFILLVILLMQIGCAECIDCDVLNSEPTLSFSFINQRAINEQSLTVDSLSHETNTLDSNLVVIEDSLAIVVDSLAIVQDSIDAGNVDYEQAALQLQVLEDSLGQLQLQLEMLFTQTDSLLDLSNSQLAILAEGLTRIDSLIALSNGNVISYQDSAAVFSVPLSIQQPETMLRLVLPVQAFFIDFRYQLIPYEDDKSRIGFVAEDIEIVSHTFDSIQFNCVNNCTSNGSTVVAYY